MLYLTLLAQWLNIFYFWISVEERKSLLKVNSKSQILPSCSSRVAPFTVETLSQPKNSCDFIWLPQLTMLPLKNSSQNKATLTSTHTDTHHITGLWLCYIPSLPSLLLISFCHNTNLQMFKVFTMIYLLQDLQTNLKHKSCCHCHTCAPCL